MKEWKPFSRLEHTSGSDKKNNVRDYSAYIFRSGECTLGFSSSGILSEQNRESFILEQKDIWSRILAEEKRHDSRLDSRLMIPIPNAADHIKIAQTIGQIFRSENVYFALAVHSGRRGKKGVVNSHMHVQFSQRNAQAGKKNRNLVSKAFLTKINSTLSAELLRQGFSLREKSRGRRPRIPRVSYQMNMRGEQILNPSALLDIKQNAILKERKEREKIKIAKNPKPQPKQPSILPARKMKLRPMPGSQPLQKRDRDDFNNPNPEPNNGPGR